MAAADDFRALPKPEQKAVANREKTLTQAKADTLAQFARRVRADPETINAIQYGKLLIEAKLGALLPRGKGGRGKKTPSPTKGVYASAAVATYRKVSDNAPKIDEYRAKVAEHNAAIGEDRPDAAGGLTTKGPGPIMRA
jgi:hypothetical protein